MAIRPTNQLATSPVEADPTKTTKKTQPSRLGRASLAAKRRVESGSTPLVRCMLQLTKQITKQKTALTMVWATSMLLVTVRAVRNTAGVATCKHTVGR